MRESKPLAVRRTRRGRPVHLIIPPWPLLANMIRTDSEQRAQAPVLACHGDARHEMGIESARCERDTSATSRWRGSGCTQSIDERYSRSRGRTAWIIDGSYPNNWRLVVGSILIAERVGRRKRCLLQRESHVRSCIGCSVYIRVVPTSFRSRACLYMFMYARRALLLRCCHLVNTCPRRQGKLYFRIVLVLHQYI